MKSMEIQAIIAKYLPGLVRSVIFLAISVILYQAVSVILKKTVGRSASKGEMSDRSSVMLLGRILKAVYLLLVVLMLLQLNGINVSAMLAGVGIAGTVIGLAAQDALKDVIRGFSIMTENFYKVGDVVKIGENAGEVIYRGVKTTKLKDMKTGNTVIISNRNVEQVEILSGLIFLDIPLPYELSLSRAEDVMEKVARAIDGLPLNQKAEYKKVSELGDSAIGYRLTVTAEPKDYYQAKRNALRETLSVLEKEGVSIPYNQIDVHQK